MSHAATIFRLLLPALVLAAAAAPARADGLVDPSQMPGPLKEVSFDQRLGDELPLDAPFVDEEGRAVTLGDYFGTRPVVLALVYYDCPMLCSLISNGLAKVLGVLEFDPGTDFEVVMVSFDARETPEMAREAAARTLARYGRPGTEDGWHFLTGPEESILRLTEAAGFRFAWVPESEEFAHASGIMVATPAGVLAQYFYGFEYPPKDLRLALVEASKGRLGNAVDQILLYCFRYDPTLGKYTAVVTRVLRLAGIVFFLGLGVFIWVLSRRGRAAVPHSTLGAAPR